MTDKQKKSLPVIGLGVLLLVMSNLVMAEHNFLSGAILGIMGILFFLVHCEEEKEQRKTDKLECTAISAALILSGISIFLNVWLFFTTITIVVSAMMVVIAMRDLFGAKEPVYSWCAFAIGFFGIVVVLYPYKGSTTSVHLAGMMLIYHGVKGFLGEIYGC